MSHARFFSFVVAVLLIATLFAGLAAVPAAAQDETQFRYDIAHTGDFNPVAGNGPSNDNLLWKYPTAGYVSSSPTVVNNVVYVGSESPDNNVYALNATTGALIWKHLVDGGVTDSSPAVANGVVYVGSYGGVVYALNAATGVELWHYTTRAGGYVTSSPAVVNGVVYVGSWDTYVYALNAATGAFIWEHKTADYVQSSPAVVGGVVYVGGHDASLHALDATTGNEIWSKPLGGYVTSSPSVVNGAVYVGSENFQVYAFNASDGTPLWAHPTAGAVISSPAVVNGVVYVGSQDKKVYALDATTGNEIWTYATTDYVRSSPAVANGVVYVGSWNTRIYAIDASSGTPLVLWSYPTDGTVYSSPAVVNCVVYVGSNDFNVYALGTPCSRNLTTTLNITTNATIAAVNQNFTINGTLSAGTSGIPGATITLQRSTDNATWSNVTNTTTGAAGNYQFSTNESTSGTYYYSTAYAGNATYPNATSRSVSVLVGGIPTQLSATAAPTTVVVNQQFTVSGTLNTTGGAPVAGATVQLQRNVGGVWTDVPGKTATTDVNGAYVITMSESAAGQYAYRTTFAGAIIGGNAYAASTSPSTTPVNVSATATPSPTLTPTPTVTPSKTPTVTPSKTPTVKPNVKPSPLGPTIPCEEMCLSVICAEVCDAHTLPACEAPTATPSPTLSLTLPSIAPLSHVPTIPEFPLAVAGAGVVAIALAGIYAVMRRRL